MIDLATKTESNRKIAERVGFLARESITEWTLRFFRERGLPPPTEQELREILEAGKNDERGGHQ